MSDSKKKILGAAATLTMLTGLMGTTNAYAEEQFNFTPLGSGEEVRGELLAKSSSPSEFFAGSTYAAKSKDLEGKCGEGKCGDGKCGDGKCGDDMKPDDEDVDEDDFFNWGKDNGKRK